MGLHWHFPYITGSSERVPGRQPPHGAWRAAQSQQKGDSAGASERAPSSLPSDTMRVNTKGLTVGFFKIYDHEWQDSCFRQSNVTALFSPSVHDFTSWLAQFSEMQLRNSAPPRAESGIQPLMLNRSPFSVCLMCLLHLISTLPGLKFSTELLQLR